MDRMARPWSDCIERMPLPPFLIDADLIPASRRSQHQKAIDVIDAHERTGAPFVLMLQSYRIMLPMVRSETDVGNDRPARAPLPAAGLRRRPHRSGVGLVVDCRRIDD